MRNILYNKSDILIAVIIIIVAAVIIWTRVAAIMDTGSADANTNGGTPVTAADGSGDVPDPGAADTPEGGDATVPPATTPEAVVTPPATEGADAAAQTDESTQEAFKYTVVAGSVWEIVADDLVAEGIIESTEVLMNEVAAQGKETMLKAGTFKIKPGTSAADIVKKLSN
ncbi:MAG: hypothetical protein LBG82_00580 [Clostridiales Family XIII bacterium]|jgi:hypothetical protein|nr:hypothetical protein [Clostridiales Family XIII bacterium]